MSESFVFCGVGGHAADDIEITVTAADIVDHFLFEGIILHFNVIEKLIHASEIRCFDLVELVGLGVLFEDVVEDVGVVKAFGDRYLQLFAGTVSAETDKYERKVNDEGDHGEYCCEEYIAHAVDKADSHREENEQYIGCGTGIGAIAYKAERACDGKTDTDVTVDDHNYDLNDKGKDDEREEYVFGAVASERCCKGYESAENDRGERTGKKHTDGDLVSCDY